MGTGRSGWGVVTRDSGHAGQQLGPTGGGQLPHWGAKRFLSSVSFLFSPGQEDLLAEGVSRVPVASCLLLFVSMKEKRREQYLTQ